MSNKPSWSNASPEAVPPDDGPSIAVLAQISDAIRNLKFGQVTVIVQDGVVVQIDRLEKHRLERAT